jgi:hypothetical protein
MGPHPEVVGVPRLTQWPALTTLLTAHGSHSGLHSPLQSCALLTAAREHRGTGGVRSGPSSRTHRRSSHTPEDATAATTTMRLRLAEEGATLHACTRPPRHGGGISSHMTQAVVIYQGAHSALPPTPFGAECPLRWRGTLCTAGGGGEDDGWYTLDEVAAVLEMVVSRELEKVGGTLVTFSGAEAAAALRLTSTTRHSADEPSEQTVWAHPHWYMTGGRTHDLSMCADAVLCERPVFDPLLEQVRPCAADAADGSSRRDAHA